VRIRTLIVDDEPLARSRVRSMLKNEPDIEIIGECGDGHSAVEAIRTKQPDLVFLDVQMPGLDGLGVVRTVGAEHMPVAVFITAHDDYALKAFEVHAGDYLLKPFDKERFQGALRWARTIIARDRTGDLTQRLSALLEDARPRSKHVERLAVKSGGRVVFLRVEEIEWIEAAGNYLRLHVGKDFHLLRETMNALEARLDPERFVRIHRSTIVNLAHVRELQPAFHGDYVVILENGAELTLSRNHRSKLQNLLGSSL
jgi:two-component system LytT family response regulator